MALFTYNVKHETKNYEMRKKAGEGDLLGWPGSLFGFFVRAYEKPE